MTNQWAKQCNIDEAMRDETVDQDDQVALYRFFFSGNFAIAWACSLAAHLTRVFKKWHGSGPG